VRVLYDYVYSVGDVCRHVTAGDECVVLCEYDEHWLYVCKLADAAQHMYVPRQFVVVISSSDVMAADPPLYASMSRCLSVNDAAKRPVGLPRRTRVASTPTAAAAGPPTDSDAGGPLTRASVISEASDDSRDVDLDDCPDDDDDDETTSDYVLFDPSERARPPPPAPAAAAAGAELDYCSTVPPCRPRRLHSTSGDSTQPAVDQLRASEIVHRLIRHLLLTTGHRVYHGRQTITVHNKHNVTCSVH